MENPNLMLCICLAAPLSMMLLVFKGRSRAMLGFLLVGIYMCLLAGEVNGLILNGTDLSLRFITVNVTPIVEEILKAIPIVFITFLIMPNRQYLLECSIAVGVGFATMENSSLLFHSEEILSSWAIVARGLGAGMMHGVTTLAVGYSMTLVREDKRLFRTGTVAALSAAIIYHSIYNIMVQSEYPLLGIILPVVTFIPLIVLMSRVYRRHDNRNKYEKKENKT